MPPLCDIQHAFARAVLEADRPVPAGLKSHLRTRPAKRFSIYRNNVYSSLIDILEGRFAVVARLLGEEFFHATVREYVAQHPPRSPVLIHYGKSFARFLEGFEPVQDLPYLPDVARLEWAWNEAYHAPDREPVRLELLQRVAQDEAGAMVFEMHPSTRLVRSLFPVVTIWTANSNPGEPAPIDADSGGEDALVVRPALEVAVLHLPPGGAAFISALGEGRPLGEATLSGAEASTEFNLQDNLTGLIASGALAAVQPAA